MAEEEFNLLTGQERDQWRVRLYGKVTYDTIKVVKKRIKTHVAIICIVWYHLSFRLLCMILKVFKSIMTWPMTNHWTSLCPSNTTILSDPLTCKLILVSGVFYLLLVIPESTSRCQWLDLSSHSDLNSNVIPLERSLYVTCLFTPVPQSY